MYILYVSIGVFIVLWMIYHHNQYNKKMAKQEAFLNNHGFSKMNIKELPFKGNFRKLNGLLNAYHNSKNNIIIVEYYSKGHNDFGFLILNPNTNFPQTKIYNSKIIVIGKDPKIERIRELFPELINTSIITDDPERLKRTMHKITRTYLLNLPASVDIIYIDDLRLEVMFRRFHRLDQFEEYLEEFENIVTFFVSPKQADMTKLNHNPIALQGVNEIKEAPPLLVTIVDVIYNFLVLNFLSLPIFIFFSMIIALLFMIQVSFQNMDLFSIIFDMIPENMESRVSTLLIYSSITLGIISIILRGFGKTVTFGKELAKKLLVIYSLPFLFLVVIMIISREGIMDKLAFTGIISLFWFGSFMYLLLAYSIFLLRRWIGKVLLNENNEKEAS